MTSVFEVIRVNSVEEMKDALSVRFRVFVEEQGINREDEIDNHEDESHHFLIREKHSNVPAGAARWRQTEQGFKLERFCVLPVFRCQGAGTLLLREVMADIENQNLQPLMYLNAQADAVSLYEKQGFKISGDQFFECSIPHFRMVYPADSHTEI